MSLSAQGIFAASETSLRLRWFVCEEHANRELSSQHGHEPADLIGHLNLIHRERIHVFGARELQYLIGLDEKRQAGLLRDLVAGQPPALIVAEDLEPPRFLKDTAVNAKIPVMLSSLSAARVVDSIRNVLARANAERTSMHGVFMDVLGMGVLISGESGLGKSELALELISRGHGLVADDVVDFTRLSPQALEGRCPEILRNLLEVRGLGLLDIRTIFGETAVRRRMRLKLIVNLVRRSKIEGDVERLPLEALTQDVLGLPVRKVVIPVAAGRNLAVLTEGAVRSTVLQLRGIDTTAEFIARQRRLIESDGQA
jgi:HPr kinase/phosphorylase